MQSPVLHILVLHTYTYTYTHISNQDLPLLHSIMSQTLILHYNKVKTYNTQILREEISQMLSKKNRYRTLPNPPPSPNLHLYLATELQGMHYNLSQPTCQFIIHPVIIPRADAFIIELYIRPRVGIFQWIEFRVRVIVDATGNARRHKIYNDRRVLHPNIHVETCEVVYPQLVREWNPTTPLSTLFMHLKHTILQPNLMFVPNTHYNRKAACAYHFKRNHYTTLMQQLSPLYLQDYINQQFDNTMQEQELFDQYWSIQQLQRKKRMAPVDDKDMEILAKKIKTLQLQEIKEINEIHNISDVHDVHDTHDTHDQKQSQITEHTQTKMQIQ